MTESSILLLGLDRWRPPQPVILLASADDAEAIAANYPRACVVSLPSDPAEQAVLTDPAAWACFLPLLGSDLTLWPVNALQVPYFAALVPILRDAGVRTLRLAVRSTDDWALYDRIEVIWRDMPLHPGPAPGSAMTLRASRCPRSATAPAGDQPGAAGARNETARDAAA